MNTKTNFATLISFATLVGDNNQIYQALILMGKDLMGKDKPIQTLTDSKTGPMTFTPLKNNEQKP